MNEKLKHLTWRAAIKQYDTSKKLTEDQLILLTEAARMAPTSFGMQPFKIIVISNQDVQNKLKESGYSQPQFSDASHVIVLAARTNVTENDVQEYIQRIIDQRNVKREEVADLEQMMMNMVKNMNQDQLHNWAKNQVYIALGMILDVAAANQIDTSPMEGFDADKFDEILNLQPDYHSVVTISAGFRSADDKYSKMPKVRKTTKDFIEYFN